MSTKSDCGVDGTRPVSWMGRSELSSVGGSVDTTRRNWSSESQLERRDHQAAAGRLQAAGHKPFKALSLNTLLKVRFIKEKKTKNKNILSRFWAWLDRGWWRRRRRRLSRSIRWEASRRSMRAIFLRPTVLTQHQDWKIKGWWNLVINGVGGCLGGWQIKSNCILYMYICRDCQGRPGVSYLCWF